MKYFKQKNTSKHDKKHIASTVLVLSFYLCIFKKRFYLFLERGEGREKGRETSIWERDMDWLPLTRPLLGTWPISQTCALTGNRTCNHLVHRLAFNLLSHPSRQRNRY